LGCSSTKLPPQNPTTNLHPWKNVSVLWQESTLRVKFHAGTGVLIEPQSVSRTGGMAVFL